MAQQTLKEIPASAWAPPPAGFTLMTTGRPERPGRIEGDFEAAVEEWRRPLKIVEPGALILGFENYRRFAAPLPAGLRLEGWKVTEALNSFPSATIGLVAGEPRRIPSGPGLLAQNFDSWPSLYKVWGRIDGRPPEGVPWALNAFRSRGKLLDDTKALWSLLEELLAGEFAPADLDVFASSPLVGSVALAACALEVVTASQSAMSARQLEAIMKATAGRLKGWAKTDVTSPFALALFADAVTDAIGRAKPSELPELVARLVPREPAAIAGGE